jgi:hypothetical protein
MSGSNRHYQHVVRMAGLFVLGISAFFVLRAWFVPDDFGVYGHYRASALELNRNKPLVHGGHAVCADCHPDVVEARAGGRHERIGCEACHGPAARHASGDDKAPLPVRPHPRDGCLKCHAKDASRPRAFPQVVAAQHAGEQVCVTCHNPHHPAPAPKGGTS